ncbi:MAG: T9SS type A sorting domain-containing protein [Candidatus Eisenbacteria bacterium]|uniref:T9SS type A sorting domain-containing protein n=1 Tax=Eiseniibacteriota bacterium TaxID=2212470 RepID=A0A933SEG5_UNCEI|nr:T9SS type A sorting domain-containing protein [Candidatus Eisenbacteria bacterium]
MDTFRFRPAPARHRSFRPGVLAAFTLLTTFFACLPLASAFAQAFNGTWTQLAAGGTIPPARRDVGAIYDGSRDRIVLLASDGFTYAMNVGTGTWSKLGTSQTGTSPGFERAVYDAVADRMIVVNSNLQVSALNLANPVAWQVLTPAGASPVARSFFALTIDLVRNRLLLFGGGPSPAPYGDLWEFSLGPQAWTQLAPAGDGPAGRWGGIAVIDPVGDRLLVGFGSVSTAYAVSGALWAVNLSGSPQWTSLPLSNPLAAPSDCMLPSVAYSPSDGGLVLFGGYQNTSTRPHLLTFAGPNAWSALTPTGGPPIARWSGNAMFRTTGSQFLLFGGFTGGTGLNDVWLLDRTPIPGPPSIASVSPAGGRVGDLVTINGTDLHDVHTVSFAGTPASIDNQYFQRLQVRVPAGAVSGPITVTNPRGTVTSATSFYVGVAPIVSAVEPDSGRQGEVVRVRGRHFADATRVKFGPASSATFAVESDSVLYATVDANAITGPVTVTNPAASGVSAFDFVRVFDNPHPLLFAVRDVRGDQGGRVQLSWQASDYDKPAVHSVTGYRVWRRGQPFAPGMPHDALPSGWIARPSASAALAAFAPPSEYWEAIATLPAAMLNGYAYTAGTTRDSAEGDPAWTAFFVQAITSDVSTFYNSVVDSGYSVDNLAPPAPGPFAVVYAPTANTLHWTARTIPDLRGYEVHRGGQPTFVPSAATLVTTTADSSYADVPGAHYYKLAAIDVHGNRSRWLSASPSSPVATLASFVRADRDEHRVALLWYSDGNAGLVARVQRRTLERAWETLGDAVADGEGWLRFEDANAEPDVRYAYRLAVLDEGGEELLLGETWVDPVRVAFAVLGAGPNPARDGRITLAFALPATASARVQLFDLAGRLVDSRVLGATTGSAQTVEFGAGARLRAGVYLVRATSGAVSLTRRVVVLN